MHSPPPLRQHLPGRGAGSEPHATQGCRNRLPFVGCRLPHGHTGSWHCNQSPRFQAGRAQSSYHAANLEEGPCRWPWGPSSPPEQAHTGHWLAVPGSVPMS